MSGIAIKVENLGKKYSLKHQVNRDEGLRHIVERVITAPFRRRKPEVADASAEDFWAIQDLNFEIKRGEVVGVIGRNGAGKSTLLKILSRITEPTTGRIEIEGRVASLLEVGTGFHPELTGRENIYLNGTILGMTRGEIRRKFDEIVAFAEIDRFLDTPVKHYSSGMYVRLAFAVAAHMEPEILIIDEVLAVGDLQFQKKCLGKMQDVSSREGRTVLFVSHNTGAILQLCTRAIALQQGRMKFIGSVEDAIGQYLSTGADRSGFLNGRGYTKRTGPGGARITQIRLLTREGTQSAEFSLGDDLIVEIEFETTESLPLIHVNMLISTSDGLNMANVVDIDSDFIFNKPGPRETVRIHLTDLRFYPGSYFLSFLLGSHRYLESYDNLEHCLEFSIVGGGKLTTRDLPRSSGLFFLTPRWERMPDSSQPLVS